MVTKKESSMQNDAKEALYQNKYMLSNFKFLFEIILNYLHLIPYFGRHIDSQNR
jgi:hypothetical protein